MATPKAVDIIQLGSALELDSDSQEQSDSDTEQEGEESFQEDNLSQEDVVLLGIEMLREQQKGDSECQSLSLCVNARASLGAMGESR